MARSSGHFVDQFQHANFQFSLLVLAESLELGQQADQEV